MVSLGVNKRIGQAWNRMNKKLPLNLNVPTTRVAIDGANGVIGGCFRISYEIMKVLRPGGFRNVELVWGNEMNHIEPSQAKFIKSHPIYSGLMSIPEFAKAVKESTIQPYNCEHVPYEGIDIMIDCTGDQNYKDRLYFEGYINQGAKMVLFPNYHKDCRNLIYGFNHEEFNPETDKAVAMGSCSMSALVPVLGALQGSWDDKFRSLSISVHHSWDPGEAEKDKYQGRYFPKPSRSLANIASFFPSLRESISARKYMVPTPAGMILDCTLEKNDGFIDWPRTSEDLLQAYFKEYDDSTISFDNVSMESVFMRPESAIVDLDQTEADRRGNSLRFIIGQDPYLGFTFGGWRMIAYMMSRMAYK